MQIYDWTHFEELNPQNTLDFWYETFETDGHGNWRTSGTHDNPGDILNWTKTGEWADDYDQLEDEGWEFMHGFSGQWRYHGPVMHDSETFSGGLADAVLNDGTPKLFTFCVCQYWDDDEDPVMEGWVCLTKALEEED